MTGLDRQRAGDLVAVPAEQLHGRRDEACGGKSLGVEPGLAGDFGIGVGGAGIDAGQFDVEAGLGAGRLRQVEGELRGEAPELPSILTPICW